METTFIYALCEPGTRTVRYIGKANNLKRRFREHVTQSLKAKTPLGCWLRSLGKELPALVVLREVPVEQWEIAEERYIRLARGCGMALVNGTDGGDGNHNPSVETRAKWSASSKGVPKSAEHRANISTSLKGRALPQTTIDAAHTPEVNKKRGDSLRGRKQPESVIAPRRGKPLPKAALLAAQTPEARAKRIASLSGHPVTPEQKAKQSVTMKLVWAKKKAEKSVDLCAPIS